MVAYIESKDGRAISYKADVSDPESVEAMFKKVDQTFGQVTGLVNNAEIMGSVDRVEKLNADQSLRMFQVNILGPFICSKEAIKRMSTNNVVPVARLLIYPRVLKNMEGLVLMLILQRQKVQWMR